MSCSSFKKKDGKRGRPRLDAPCAICGVIKKNHTGTKGLKVAAIQQAIKEDVILPEMPKPRRKKLPIHRVIAVLDLLEDKSTEDDWK